MNWKLLDPTKPGVWINPDWKPNPPTKDDVIKIIKDLPENLRLEISMLIEKPKIGSKWRHHNGCGPYIVLHIANIESLNEKHPPTVVYQGENKAVWTRPLDQWYAMKELI